MKTAAILLMGALALWGADGVISGTVRSATSHLPLEGAYVSLTGEESTGEQTDVRGGFRFADLPAGHYSLRVQKAGYTGNGPLQVAAGAQPVVMEMYPLGQIEGRVLDEAGDPAGGVTVEAIGMPALGEATSEKDGRFLLSNLYPLDYVIRLRIPAALRKAGYPAVEFYPGVTEGAQAVPVHVADGVQMAGFDIRLHRVPLVKFRGHVVDLGKDESARVVEVALDSEPGPIAGSYARHPVDAGGRFHFEEVPPGRHVLLVYRGTGSDDLPYAASVDVGKDEVPVPVPPFADLEGVVKSTARTASEGVLGIGLGADGAWRRNVIPEEGGTFTLPNVPPGEWRLRLESNSLEAAGRKLRVASARFGAANVIDEPITVTESGNPPITITLSDESGSIAGTVEQGTAKPEQVIVWALPLDGRSNGNASALAQPDGSFLIRDLLPGDYRVAALGITASRNSGAGTDCIQRLEKVTVTNGQTATLRLTRCDQ